MPRCLTALVAALFATAALAQHRHAHPLRSWHGGEVVEGRRHHFELVLLPAAEAGATELALHVTDHRNRPSALESAVAEATVTAKGAATMVPLVLAGANVLKGVGRFPADPAMEVRVAVTVGKLPPETLTFRPLKPVR